jgi:hypothetical protein
VTEGVLTPRDLNLATWRGSSCSSRGDATDDGDRATSRSPRALATGGPVTTADAIERLAAHDLGGLDARRAWHYTHAAAHLGHHHETALHA